MICPSGQVSSSTALRPRKPVQMSCSSGWGSRDSQLRRSTRLRHQLRWLAISFTPDFPKQSEKWYFWKALQTDVEIIQTSQVLICCSRLLSVLFVFC